MDQNDRAARVVGYEEWGDAKYGVRFVRLPGAWRPSALATDALAGLSHSQKHLPPKYFYDAHGSLLFEGICATPEYYPTRTESALLAANAQSILEETRPGTLVELGSGSSQKTCHLFDACEQLGLAVRYQPLDVCAEALDLAAARLRARYPWLTIEALIGDYSVDLAEIPYSEAPRLFLFLGGTLGNLAHREALRFLKALHGTMRRDDFLLLGFDRVKDSGILNAAYNDAEGYTAAFNLNVLKVMNDHLDANFDRDAFSHQASFNEARGQIEMRLVAERAHCVTMPRIDLEVEFAHGESILTEISRKFSPMGMRELLEAAGFRWCRHDEPENGYFSLVLATPQ
ncbi:MAG: L-histidine N(alpha)-methyltransferase [Acidiferrobacter sp.]